MTCGNCGTDKAARKRIGYDHKTGRRWEYCDLCGNLSPVWIPDVYLGGPGGTMRTDPNLCDPKTGKEIPFSTKREKAAVMRYLGVRQADSAERQGGCRNEMYLHRKKYFEV